MMQSAARSKDDFGSIHEKLKSTLLGVFADIEKIDAAFLDREIAYDNDKKVHLTFRQCVAAGLFLENGSQNANQTKIIVDVKRINQYLNGVFGKDVSQLSFKEKLILNAVLFSVEFKTQAEITKLI